MSNVVTNFRLSGLVVTREAAGTFRTPGSRFSSIPKRMELEALFYLVFSFIRCFLIVSEALETRTISLRIMGMSLFAATLE